MDRNFEEKAKTPEVFKAKSHMSELCKFGTVLSLITACLIIFIVFLLSVTGTYITIGSFAINPIFFWIGAMFQIVSIIICANKLTGKPMLNTDKKLLGIWVLLFTNIIGGIAILCANELNNNRVLSKEQEDKIIDEIKQELNN